MFIEQQGLPHVLPTEWYHSPPQHEREVATLFRSAWHLVGSAADVPRSGDFVTFDLLGEPLIVFNFDGDHQAFLNVCAHRHCLLTSRPQGHAEQLRCQYHGWRYDRSGQACDIPEAEGFAPIDPTQTRLHRFDLARCGELLFVRPSATGPSLRQFLGPFHDVIAERFSSPWRQNWAWENDFDANWKIPVENTLESYHLHSVHKGAFSTAKSSEAAQEHVLDEAYSSLRYDVGENRLLSAAQSFMARLLGLEPTNVYTHVLIHPNFVLTINDFFVHAQSYLPVGPTTSRTLIRMYSYRPPGGGLRSLAGGAAARIGRIGNLKIQTEDAHIFGPTQRGITRSRRPGRLSRREERVHTFQRYVAARCGAGTATEGSSPAS